MTDAPEQFEGEARAILDGQRGSAVSRAAWPGAASPAGSTSPSSPA